MARPWVKLYCQDWITGSIRADEPIARDVLTGLLCLAGLSYKSNEGKVELIGGIPYEMSQLAEVLKIPQEQLETALKTLEAKERIKIDKGIITILNWNKFQSEYERTRPYRVVEKVQPRVEVEKEVEKKDKDNLFTFWESHMGLLNPTTGDILKDWEKTYPADWIKDAIKEAVKANARNANYVKTVLQNWQDKGRGSRKQEPPKRKRRVI